MMNPVEHGPANRREITRRVFLEEAAAGAVASGLIAHPSVGPARKQMSIRNIGHVVIDSDKKTRCGHPRQCGIKHFGNRELAVLYCRAPASEAVSGDASDMRHRGFLDRADVVLRRSSGDGRTWPPESEVVLWSNAAPLEERAKFLCQDAGLRQVLDMSRPETMFFFGRTEIRLKKTVRRNRFSGWTSELALVETQQNRQGRANGDASTLFQIRSADKGQTWEQVPLVLDPPPKAIAFWKDNHPLVMMPDGALVGAMESERALWLYGSECQGMTWQYLSLITMPKQDAEKPCCAGLVLLANGRLQCYMVLLSGQCGSLCLSESDDCFSWSPPRSIASGVRSAWPLRLGDGRIVVVCARGEQPAGIAAIVSEDLGRTWFDAGIIRDSAGGLDMADPAATELDGARVFTAYGCRAPGGTSSGGTHFMAGSFFDLA